MTIDRNIGMNPAANAEDTLATIMASIDRRRATLSAKDRGRFDSAQEYYEKHRALDPDKNDFIMDLANSLDIPCFP